MSKIIKNSKFFEILFIFLISLTPFLWLRNGQVILGHDSGFRLDSFTYWLNLLYSWNPIPNFGSDWSIFKGFLITQLPEALFTTLTGSLGDGQLLTFIFWFFAIGLSMYIFVNSFHKDSKFWFLRIFASTFYMYNFFLLQAWFIAERAKFSIYIALPLCVLLLYKTLTKQISLWKGLFFFSLLLFFFNAGGAPTFLGSFFVSFAATLIYFAIRNFQKGGIRELTYALKVGILFLVGFIIVNAYWILPQAYLMFHNYSSSLVASGGINGIIGWEATISKNASLINLLRLQGIPDWYKNPIHPYSSFYLENVFLIGFSFLFPIILVGSLILIAAKGWKNHNRQLLLLILALFLIGIIFTAGSHPPTGFLYVLLIKYIPVFPIFRSSFYKFGVTFWFPAIFLISYGLYAILTNYIKNKKLYFLCSALAVVAILAFHFPYFSANFFTWNKPYSTRVKIPSYVATMSNYINTLPSSTRILLLPSLDPVFHADITDWNFWSLDLLPRLTTNKSIVADSAGAPPIIGNMYRAIELGNEEQFLRLAYISGVNKILWRDDAVYSNGTKVNAQLHYRENTIKSFHSLRLLKQEGKWRLYDIAFAKLPMDFFVPDNISVNSKYNSYQGQLMAEKSTTGSALLEDAKFSLGNVVNKQYIQANCVLCEMHAFENIAARIDVPQLRLLPNSKLYFLVKAKEYIGLLRTKGYEARALTDMIYSYRRIAEINNLLRKNNDDHNFNQEVFSNISRFKKNINNALAEANLLSVEKRNDLLIRIYAYLYHENSSTNSFIHNSQANAAIDNLELFIVQKMNMLENTIWMTKDKTDKKYFVDIPFAGNYSLVFTNIGQVTPSEIYLDGERINAQDARMEKGTHKLEVIYSPLENMLVKPADGELSFNIPNGEKERFTLKPLSRANLYTVSFDYRFNSGIPPNIKITQDAIESDNKYELTRKDGELLSAEGTWNRYEYIVGGDPNSKNFSLDFLICCKNGKNSNFTIKNLNVAQLFEPGVNFVSTNTNVQDTRVGNISYRQLDPTKYIVSVHNAATPYVLSSRIGYDAGWKALVLDSSKSQNNSSFATALFQNGLQQITPYKTNTFANAWYINKKGSYDVLIEYEPQRFFYIGGLISLISFPLLASLFIFKGKKQ
ncbi:MAG: hypothetical protein Q7R31_02915 [Candidatus Levybacteria bacterium]|nr:hypothetical protein [Candidatus Levybacteria bacterium]